MRREETRNCTGFCVLEGRGVQMGTFRFLPCIFGGRDSAKVGSKRAVPVARTVRYSLPLKYGRNLSGIGVI